MLSANKKSVIKSNILSPNTHLRGFEIDKRYTRMPEFSPISPSKLNESVQGIFSGIYSMSNTLGVNTRPPNSKIEYIVVAHTNI